MTDPTPRWDRPVMVLSQGRTGSTFLQRLLNLNPYLTIWGEHGAFLKGFASAHRLIVDHPNHSPNLRRGYESRDNVIGELSDAAAFEPWVSPVLPEHVGAVFQEALKTVFTRGLDPSVRWGFKEVRYSARDIEPILALFPQAHLVVLVREFFDWAPSRFFAFGKEFDFESAEGRDRARGQVTEMADAWLATYGPLADLVDQRDGLATAIDYAALSDPDSVTQLFLRLGETPPPRAKLDQVINARVGSTFESAKPAAARPNFVELVDSMSLDRETLSSVYRQLRGV